MLALDTPVKLTDFTVYTGWSVAAKIPPLIAVHWTLQGPMVQQFRHDIVSYTATACIVQQRILYNGAYLV